MTVNWHGVFPALTTTGPPLGNTSIRRYSVAATARVRLNNPCGAIGVTRIVFVTGDRIGPPTDRV